MISLRGPELKVESLKIFLSSDSPGQLPGRWVQVPNRRGFVPGLDLPGWTCIPTWWSDWPVTVLERKYFSHLCFYKDDQDLNTQEAVKVQLWCVLTKRNITGPQLHLKGDLIVQFWFLFWSLDITSNLSHQKVTKKLKINFKECSSFSCYCICDIYSCDLWNRSYRAFGNVLLQLPVFDFLILFICCGQRL